MRILLCFIVFSSISYSQNTYNDVAGIFWNKCASCHNPNGNAPFGLSNYVETKAVMNNIVSVIQDNCMPPWQPDSTYKHFSKERFLSFTEKAAIFNWVLNGGQEGDPSDLPAAPVFPKYKISEAPHKVVKIPNFQINSTPNHDAYDVFAIPLNIPSTKYLRAIEIVPNHPGVVHHVVVSVDTTNSMLSDLSGSAYGQMGQIAISGSVADPVVYPNSPMFKTGVRIPGNSQLYVQMHYSESSGGLIDSTEFRLYFYPDNEQGIREMYIMVPLQNWYFWINPEEIKTIEVDSTQFNTFDISLFSALPHSHKICTKVLNYAYNPLANDTIPLIKINKWDADHQEYYYYKKMVHIPPGYRYKGIHTYENTSTNPNNPFNPPQWMPVGLNSNEEMFFDAFQWLVYYPGDENINIDSLLRNDPLTTANLEEITYSKNWLKSTVFPNPSNDKMYVYFTGNHMDFTNMSIKINDHIGKTIIVDQFNENSYCINGNLLESGTYYYFIYEKEEIISFGKFTKLSP